MANEIDSPKGLNAPDLAQLAILDLAQRAIEEYRNIKNALEGNDPEWVLPPLNKKARLTKPALPEL